MLLASMLYHLPSSVIWFTRWFESINGFYTSRFEGFGGLFEYWLRDWFAAIFENRLPVLWCKFAWQPPLPSFWLGQGLIYLNCAGTTCILTLGKNYRIIDLIFPHQQFGSHDASSWYRWIECPGIPRKDRYSQGLHLPFKGLSTTTSDSPPPSVKNSR